MPKKSLCLGLGIEGRMDYKGHREAFLQFSLYMLILWWVLVYRNFNFLMSFLSWLLPLLLPSEVFKIM